MNKNELIINIFGIIAILNLVASQRVAPGVAPQHYQQPQFDGQQQYQPPNPQQQYQQPNPQQLDPRQPPNVNPNAYQPNQQQLNMQPNMQPNMQQPNMPQQPGQMQQLPPRYAEHQAQHPQHPPQQQMPHGGGHDHGHHGQQQVLNAGNIREERQHIAEHMEVPIDTSKMTDEELQFHYFKMHDADNNNKLDGCELIKSLIHWHAQGSTDNKMEVPSVEEKVFSDEELTTLIDPILSTDDLSYDGFIDYPEFIRAQQKSAAQES